MSKYITVNTNLSLIEGETIDCMLGKSENTNKCDEKNYLVLTDRRLIDVNPSSSNMSFTDLCNISSINLETARMTSRRGYIWGALALIASTIMWQILEQPTLSIATAIVVAVIGLYLIIDNRFSPIEIRVHFNAGSATVVFKTCHIDKKPEILNFINRMSQIKEKSRDYNSPRNFSPR